MDRLPALLAAAALAMASLNAQASLTCVDYQTNDMYTWTVGGTVAEQSVTPNNENHNAYCWANGRELRYIQSNFSGLRSRILPTVEGQDEIIFINDDARFIISNL